MGAGTGCYKLLRGEINLCCSCSTAIASVQGGCRLYTALLLQLVLPAFIVPLHSCDLDSHHAPSVLPPCCHTSLFGMQFVSLRSSNDAVRAAAIEAAGDLTASQRMLELAAESPPLLSALIDLWEGITDALPGELSWGAAPAWGSYAVCRCCALGT